MLRIGKNDRVNSKIVARELTESLQNLIDSDKETDNDSLDGSAGRVFRNLIDLNRGLDLIAAPGQFRRYMVGRFSPNS